MTPQERELLTDLFDRLKQCDRNPKDPEAERFIAQAVAAQPSAPYFMAQLLLVQDQALTATQARIRQLEQEVEAARAQPAAPARSFLGDAPTSGPWGTHRAAVAPQVAPAPATSTTGYTPPPASTSGGFLRGALQTAAGVAGGALLFEGIGSLLPHGGGWGGGFLPTGAPTLVEETVINEYGNALQRPPETGSDRDAGSATQAADDDTGLLMPATDDLAGDDADWADDQEGHLV